MRVDKPHIGRGEASDQDGPRSAHRQVLAPGVIRIFIDDFGRHKRGAEERVGKKRKQ